MSDSEFETKVIASRVQKSKPAKAISSPISKSDSEDETPSKHIRPTKPKRKSMPRAPSKTNTSKKRCTKTESDLIGLLSSDEEEAACSNASRRAAAKKQLASSICSKVANGSVVRRAQLDGLYYAEVRLYATQDALYTSPETRYTKALVTLKVQLQPDQPEWDLLQKFLKKTKRSLFNESEPVFYTDNIKK